MDFLRCTHVEKLYNQTTVGILGEKTNDVT